MTETLISEIFSSVMIKIYSIVIALLFKFKIHYKLLLIFVHALLLHRKHKVIVIIYKYVIARIHIFTTADTKVSKIFTSKKGGGRADSVSSPYDKFLIQNSTKL